MIPFKTNLLNAQPQTLGDKPSFSYDLMIETLLKAISGYCFL